MPDKIVVDTLYFGGMSPQKAIRHLTDLISRTKQEDKRFLLIEEYNENYGNPFAEPTKCLRLITRKP